MSRFARGRGGGRGGASGGFDDLSGHPSNTVHPSMLKQARRTGILNLSQRGLTSVPENVWTVQEHVPDEARTVNLDNTEDKWWDTVDLTKLILASNRLTSLDDGLSKLAALNVLDLHDNQLTSLPKAIGTLECLQKLDVSHNQLQEIPPFIGFLHSLTTLQLDHNHLTSVCEEVCSLKYLETLNISYNQIETIPRYICLLSQIRTLNISYNRIRELPPDIGALDALRILDATHNQLNRIPEECGQLMKLEQLHLRHNQLQYLPVLRNCINLKELLVGNNNIRGLTKEHLEHFGNLGVLDLRDNKLSTLPDEITLLEKLERLDLTNNDLSTLPFALGVMTNLKSVVLDGNPMRSIRRDIIMRGTTELKKYLASRLSADEHEQQTKSEVRPTQVAMPGSGDCPIISASEMQQMKSLDYSNKKASSIPDEVLEAALEAGVKNVNLSKNVLMEFPSNLSVLAHKLCELNLGYNRLLQLSPAVAQFTKMYVLDVRNNQLTDLPIAMVALVNLRELNLSYNKLKSIPSVIYSLPEMEILFLNDNQISQIDVEGLGSLKKLGTLDLNCNDLAQVPPELGNLTWLKSLSLNGNPLRQPRPAILAKGTNAILEYLRSRIIT